MKPPARRKPFVFSFNKHCYVLMRAEDFDDLHAGIVRPYYALRKLTKTHLQKEVQCQGLFK